MATKYEDMQRRFAGHIKSPTEHELWNLWVEKDEQYRLTFFVSCIGWAFAIASSARMIFW